MATQSNANSVSVEIYDQTYNLRGVDPAHIAALAQIVDGKMRAVSSNSATVDSLRVAVLAALNIADELVELRNRHNSLLESLDLTESATRRRAGALSNMLDEALSEDFRHSIAV